jgi:lipopolysaccharide/colanic/teichoic acid biosynthesis glycosyltransferase
MSMNDFYKRYGKRFLDIVIVLTMTVLLSWLILVIILLYVMSFQFPILFVQKRIGKNDIPFYMWKFRTLSPKVERPLQERRFMLGDFLRSCSLDELPQLWNVLKGDMSLIGPRPLLPEYLSLFTETQRQRHNVRPGITGLTQVSGRTSLPWEKKFALDSEYVENLSLALDSKILVRTILLLFAFKRDVSLDEKPFSGKNE